MVKRTDRAVRSNLGTRVRRTTNFQAYDEEARREVSVGPKLSKEGGSCPKQRRSVESWIEKGFKISAQGQERNVDGGEQGWDEERAGGGAGMI